MRNLLGYLLGLLLFVGLMPTLMWLASGMPAFWTSLGGQRYGSPTADAYRIGAEHLDYSIHEAVGQGQSYGCLWA